jgi:hypothetical protein
MGQPTVLHIVQESNQLNIIHFAVLNVMMHQEVSIQVSIMLD